MDEAANAWFLGRNAGSGALSLYRVSKTGAATTVAATDATTILCGPVQGADGAFYAVTGNGTGGAQSLLRVTTGGASSLVPLTVDGLPANVSLRGDLVEREPGVFFVTSSTAGPNGTLTYRIHQLAGISGVLSELKAFPSVEAGARAGISQFVSFGFGDVATPGGIFIDPTLRVGPDDQLYGTLPHDVAQAGGEIFRVNLPARSGPLPAAVTGNASAIGVTTATLSAEATANTTPAYAYVEFGASDKYGFRTFPVDLGTGGAATPLAFSLGSLAPGTTYHFRTAAVSAGGVVHGFDQTFTTLPNARPVANADGLSIRLAGAPAPGQIAVLANDSDPDNDPLSVESYSQPSRGTLSLNAGVFTYTPGSNFSANDSFSYTITDGIGSATALVTISAVANNAPALTPDTGTLRAVENITLAVLANDSDPDGDPFSLTSFTQGSFGSVSRSGDSLTYSPGKTFNGTDSFTYTVTDGFGATATANVIIRNPYLQLKGTYTLLIGEGSGSLKVSVGPSGTLSGTLKLPGGTAAFKGSVAESGFFSQSIKRKGKPDLLLELMFDNSTGIPTVRGTANDGGSNVAFGPQAILSQGLPAGILAGRITVRFAPRPGIAPELDAAGWAAGSVSKTGVVALAGQVPDGTAFSLSGPLRRDGSAAIFKGGSASAPSFYLELAFAAAAQSDFAGTLHWKRAAVSKGFHLPAIDITLDAAGARFIPAPKLTRTLAYSVDGSGSARATIRLEGGGLSPAQAADYAVTYLVSTADALSQDQPANPAQLKASINRSTGIFSGSFKHPALDPAKTAVPFKGVILQKPPGGTGPNAAIGTFRGPTHAGNVRLAPIEAPAAL